MGVKQNTNDNAGRIHVSPEQLRYAKVLNAGMRAGLVVLVAGLFAYVSGLVPAHVPLEQLPALWTLSAPEYLRATGMPDGWGWLHMLDSGDALPLVGIAILAGVSGVCFLVLLPLYFSNRDPIYFSIAALEIGVLALAASGILTSGH